MGVSNKNAQDNIQPKGNKKPLQVLHISKKDSQKKSKEIHDERTNSQEDIKKENIAVNPQIIKDNSVKEIEESEIVPANPLCSGEKPIYCVGSFFNGISEENNFKTSLMISSTKILSVARGKCGPCCSTAPNGQITVDLFSFAILSISCQFKYSNLLGIGLKFINFNFEY